MILVDAIFYFRNRNVNVNRANLYHLAESEGLRTVHGCRKQAMELRTICKQKSKLHFSNISIENANRSNEHSFCSQEIANKKYMKSIV